jgi:hypothetical protein
MNRLKQGAALLVLLMTFATTVHAQSGASAVTDTAKKEFPLWAKDLRRAEIVAFGSFPFTFFTATFAIDTYRMSQHDWDRRYAPWPLKAAGAVSMTKDEQLLTIGIAALTSVTISIIDYVIVRLKRAAAERELSRLPQGDPIIIRNPWPAVESETDETGGDGDNGGAPETSAGASGQGSVSGGSPPEEQ